MGELLSALVSKYLGKNFLVLISDNELRFWGRKGNEETPNKVSVTVRVL